MTAVAEAQQPGSEAISSPQSAVVGIIAGEGAQIGVLLDANAPVSVMVDPLLKVINVRLRELGLPELEAKQRGRWALCLVDGTPLRAAQSLSEQDIFDGDRLWLRFVEDTEHRSQVIEHISTAVSVSLSKRFAPINPTVAIQVGAAMVAAGVLLGSGLLGWFRSQHESWVPAPYAVIIAVLVITAALMILGRAKTVQDRRAGDILMWSGLAPLAVAAAAAPPGPVGAPHAVMGFAVAGVGAMLAMRFTGRRLGTGTAIVTICLAATIASLAADGIWYRYGDAVDLHPAGLCVRLSRARRHCPAGCPVSGCRCSRLPPAAGCSRPGLICRPPWCTRLAAAVRPWKARRPSKRSCCGPSGPGRS